MFNNQCDTFTCSSLNPHLMLAHLMVKIFDRPYKTEKETYTNYTKKKKKKKKKSVTWTLIGGHDD